MGLYFLESGAAFRNSNVVYDREGSSFATLRPGMIDWEKILSDAGWFHCQMISSVLTEAKYKTGLFISPFITDFRERIQINGEMIPKQK